RKAAEVRAQGPPYVVTRSLDNRHAPTGRDSRARGPGQAPPRPVKAGPIGVGAGVDLQDLVPDGSSKGGARLPSDRRSPFGPHAPVRGPSAQGGQGPARGGRAPPARPGTR